MGGARAPRARVGDHTGVGRGLGAGAAEVLRVHIGDVWRRRYRGWRRCRCGLRTGRGGTRFGRGRRFWGGGRGRLYGLRAQQQRRNDLVRLRRPHDLMVARNPDDGDDVQQEDRQHDQPDAAQAAKASKAAPAAGSHIVRVVGRWVQRIQDRRKAVVRPAASAAPAGRSRWCRRCFARPGRSAPGIAGRWRRIPVATWH